MPRFRNDPPDPDRVNPSLRAPLKVGLDLDGVFADFCTGFAKLLVETSGRDLFPKPWDGPSLWNWWAPLGYRRSESDAAWKAVQDRPDFWASLSPLAHAHVALTAVRQLQKASLLDPYFLTTRPGPTAHAQSVDWLVQHGVPNPNVTLCASPDAKGLMARNLQLALVVDDHCENLIAVKMHSTARLVLYDQPWSTNYRDDVLGYGGVVIRHHEQLADKLKEWAGV